MSISKRRNALAAMMGLVACVGFLMGTSQTLANGGKHGAGKGGTPATFSGQATVLNANILGVSTSISDTGPIAASGGCLETSLLQVSVPGLLSAEVAHATVVSQGDRSRAEASVAEVDLTVGGNTITADLIKAKAEARCGSVTGSSELVNLVINGTAIVVSGDANQTVNLPGGGVIIINEQSGSTTKKSGDITVAALHIFIPGVADVVVASVHADIFCPGKPQCVGGDFVTGGGFIYRSGAKANFGVAGGLKKNNELWGHLVYHDHGANIRVKATAILAYTIVSPTARRIDGTCEINGVPGQFSVVVSDNGEPGRFVDTFAIQLSTGYSAAATLSGGNIQLHKPCR